MIAAICRNRRRSVGPRRGHRRQRAGVLRRARPQGTHRPPRRRRRRPRLLQHRVGALPHHDAGSAEPAEAGDRGRPGRSKRRRMPARRDLRPRGRLDGGDLRHARRQHRPVLLVAHGGAVAQRRAQACDGDAADRRSRQRGSRAQDRARQPARRPRHRARGSDRARSPHRFEVCRRDQDRQAGVLCAARDGFRRSGGVRRRGHGRQHARGRCRRRHRRLHRQAQAATGEAHDGPLPGRPRAATTTATFAASSTP